jgi:hypothetical protein
MPVVFIKSDAGAWSNGSMVEKQRETGCHPGIKDSAGSLEATGPPDTIQTIHLQVSWKGE